VFKGSAGPNLAARPANPLTRKPNGSALFCRLSWAVRPPGSPPAAAARLTLDGLCLRVLSSFQRTGRLRPARAGRTPLPRRQGNLTIFQQPRAPVKPLLSGPTAPPTHQTVSREPVRWEAATREKRAGGRPGPLTTSILGQPRGPVKAQEDPVTACPNPSPAGPAPRIVLERSLPHRRLPLPTDRPRSDFSRYPFPPPSHRRTAAAPAAGPPAPARSSCRRSPHTRQAPAGSTGCRPRARPRSGHRRPG